MHVRTHVQVSSPMCFVWKSCTVIKEESYKHRNAYAMYANMLTHDLDEVISITIKEPLQTTKTKARVAIDMSR